MKQSIYLSTIQQLSITPQLQQAIKLLQLSRAELALEIAAEVESNPMLEFCETANIDQSQCNDDNGHTTDIVDTNDASFDYEYEIATDKDYQLYNDSNQASTASGLHDYLFWQLNLSNFSPQEKFIAEIILDAINNDGYLSCTASEILANTKQLAFQDPDTNLNMHLIELADIETVLYRIQAFEPCGVAARNLQECLRIQLKATVTTPANADLALHIIEHHFDLLSKKKYAELAKTLNITESKLSVVINFLTSLNPKPGSSISDDKPEYITPELIVTKHGSSWRVMLNPALEHHIRINPYYASIIKQTTLHTDYKFLQDQLTAAKWFLKSLQHRNATLLKVATCIIEHQQSFLNYGNAAMRPLIMQDIATKTLLHESTISRITTQKYIHTPHGTFELKHFFSSYFTTQNGEDCSATAIRDLIKQLISKESSNKPLSDSKIAEILAKQGIDIARRTVTKYREALAIPASNQRKGLR